MTNPKNPITAEEKGLMLSTMQTAGWAVFEGWLRSAKDTAIGRCAEVPEDHRYYQGIAAGVGSIDKWIKDFKAIAASKETSGT